MPPPITIVDAPGDLFDYLSEDEDKRVLAFSVDMDGITNALAADGFTDFCGLIPKLDYKVQVDSSPNFNTPNLLEYTKETALQYQEGVFVKAFEVGVPSRHSQMEMEHWWRAKHETDGASFALSSEYSEPTRFVTKKDQTLDISKRMIDALPDGNAYTKEVYSSKVYLLFRQFANEFDDLLFENQRTKDDISILLSRESKIRSTYGVLFDFDKPDSVTHAEYKRLLELMKNAYGVAGSKEAINSMIKALTGATPDLQEFRNRYSWILHEDRQFPYVEPPADYANDPDQHYYILAPGEDRERPTATLFSREEKSFSLIMRIKNPFCLNLDRGLIRQVVDVLKPAHSKIYIVFELEDGSLAVASFWDLAAYWDMSYWSSAGLVDEDFN